MDCQHLNFSPGLGAKRREKAAGAFGQGVVTKIIGLALYWLGAKRPEIAAGLGIPENSLRTTVRVFMQDGLAALEDRRRSHRPTSFLPAPPEERSSRQVELRVEDDVILIAAGGIGSPVTVPAGNRVQSRVVLLSFVNSGLLSARAAGEALGLSDVHVRSLAKRLLDDDVEALLDRRRGRQGESVLIPEVKAEIVLQCSANAVTGRSTASKAIAADIGERTGTVLSDRTLRHCIAKVGLRKLMRELPSLITDIKGGSRA